MSDLTEHEANQIKEAIQGDAQSETQGENVLTFSDGTQIDLSNCPKDHKGRPIVPDQIMEKYYSELPNGTVCESGLYQAHNGGKLRMLGVDREGDKEIQTQGGKTIQATLRQRRTFAEDIDIMLKTSASAEDIAELGLSEGATKQQALVAAMYREAIQKGTVRAADFIRDTVGEKPADRQEIDANIITDADKALLERVAQRLGEA